MRDARVGRPDTLDVRWPESNTMIANPPSEPVEAVPRVASASGRVADVRSTAEEKPASLRWAPVPALVVLALSVAGGAYYVLPIALRVRHPWHPWLRPSGYIGQTAGILCFACFLFLWLYPLRKRVRWLAFTGSLAKWIDVHITVGLLVPVLGAVHAGWNFGGLIGLGYIAMCVVALSGMVGRYLYVRIPRHKSGLELSRDEAATRRRQLVTVLSSLTKLPPAEIEAMLAPRDAGEGGLLSTVAVMVRDDFARRSAVRELVARAKAQDRGDLKRESLREVLAMARKEMALAQQIRLLDRTSRIFRLWHVAHRPFAISAFAAVTVHVVVVVVVGATWIW